MAFDFDRFAVTLVRDAPDAVIYADAKGQIVFWNKAAERLFGYAAEEAEGKSLDLIIPENLRKRHWDGFEATMRTGESKYGAGDLLAVPALRKDGTRISIEFTIHPFRAADGRIEGIAAILRDATKRFLEMKSLRAQLDDLRKSKAE